MTKLVDGRKLLFFSAPTVKNISLLELPKKIIKLNNIVKNKRCSQPFVEIFQGLVYAFLIRTLTAQAPLHPPKQALPETMDRCHETHLRELTCVPQPSLTSSLIQFNLSVSVKPLGKSGSESYPKRDKEYLQLDILSASLLYSTKKQNKTSYTPLYKCYAMTNLFLRFSETKKNGSN